MLMEDGKWLVTSIFIIFPKCFLPCVKEFDSILFPIKVSSPNGFNTYPGPSKYYHLGKSKPITAYTVFSSNAVPTLL